MRTQTTKSRIVLAGQSVPSPADVAAGRTKLRKMSQDLGIDGQGGEPPLGMQGLKDSTKVLDSERGARVTMTLLADELFHDDLQPVAALITALRQAFADSEASWKLYNEGYLFMQQLSDYQLAIGAGHRLVRRRVVLGTEAALRRTDLPDDERAAIGLDLAELSALIQQELLDLQSARDAGVLIDANLSALLDELSAEAHLVDVMRRIANKEPVSEGELDAASITYQSYVNAESPDSRSAPR